MNVFVPLKKGGGGLHNHFVVGVQLMWRPLIGLAPLQSHLIFQVSFNRRCDYWAFFRVFSFSSASFLLQVVYSSKVISPGDTGSP